jgi:hypothetical protein
VSDARKWFLGVHRPRSAAFVITGYIEGEAVACAEPRDGELVPAGLVIAARAGRRR